MCTFTTASEKVKAIGYFDLALTILTIVVIGYGVILPYSPYSTGASKVAQSPKILVQERGKPKILKPLDIFPFWLSVGLFGILGLIGILWSLVLIKTSGLEDWLLQATRVKEKYKMLGYWLICNEFLAIVLSYLWIWVVSIGALRHENFYGNFAIQISYGFCYLLRIPLIFLVWRERRKFSGEREMTDVDVERWRTHVGYDREGERKAALGKFRGRFYSRTIAKDMFHGNNLELKPYRGEGLLAKCECVAPNANL